LGETAAKSVLIVEDDADIRDALARILESEGFSVGMAENGAAALERLRSPGEVMPRLILLDLMMPVMDGWQFRAEQRKDARMASIPVVVLSAHGGVQQQATAIEAAHYLKKPIDLDVLLDTVRKFCT
jgi:CheY-like chemotaxis protein